MQTSEFGINNLFRLEKKYFGQEKRPVVVVDSPFFGVEELRRYAVERSHFGAADSFYPGIRMEVPPLYSIALLQVLRDCVAECFNLNLRQIKKVASRYSIVTARPEDLSPMQTIPHFDAPNAKGLAMVFFLQMEDCAGTAFYRHRKTGYEYIDEDRYGRYMPIIREELQSRSGSERGYIHQSTSQFEQIGGVDGKFNRLIVYFGSSLHSGVIGPDYNFDPNPATGRLTITTFVDCK